MIDLNAQLSYQTKPYDHLGTHTIYALSSEGLNSYQNDKEHITHKYLSRFHPKIMKYVYEHSNDQQESVLNKKKIKNDNVISKKILLKNTARINRNEILKTGQISLQKLPQINQTNSNFNESENIQTMINTKMNLKKSAKNNVFQNYQNNKLSQKKFHIDYSSYKDPSTLNSLIYSTEYPLTKNTKLLNTIGYGSSSLTNNSNVDLDEIVYNENERLKKIILSQSNLNFKKKKESKICNKDNYFGKYVPQIGELRHPYVTYTKSPDFFGYYHE
jgi:hypothetical protein